MLTNILYEPHIIGDKEGGQEKDTIVLRRAFPAQVVV